MATDVIRGSAAFYSSGTPGRAIVQIKSNHLVTDDLSEPSSYYHGPGRSTRLTRICSLHITGETMFPPWVPFLSAGIRAGDGLRPSDRPPAPTRRMCLTDLRLGWLMAALAG